jgi:hypothetical protein
MLGEEVSLQPLDSVRSDEDNGGYHDTPLPQNSERGGTSPVGALRHFVAPRVPNAIAAIADIEQAGPIKLHYTL